MMDPILYPMDTRMKDILMMLMPEISDEGTKGTLFDKVIKIAKVEWFCSRKRMMLMMSNQG